MNRSSPAVPFASESPSRGHRSSLTAGGAESERDRDDVDRWVAMINAERHADNEPEVAASRTNHKPSIEPSAVQTNGDDRELVEVTIEFGRTLAESTSAQFAAGSLLQLDQLADEPINLTVAGRPVARGELFVVDGKLGVRIVELLAILLASLVLWPAAGVADERPRERESLLQLEAETPEVFDTPLDQTRGTRSAVRQPSPPKWESHADTDGADADISEKADPVKLTRPSDTRRVPSGRTPETARGWGSTVWPLVIVVGLIVLGARWLKSHSPTAVRGLPTEVLDVLGRKAVDPRMSIVLVRCGSRLLLLSASAGGLRTLAVITDPVEIDCLAGLCRATERDQGLVETFRSLLQRPAPAKTSIESSRTAAESRWPERILPPRPLVPPSPEVRS